VTLSTREHIIRIADNLIRDRGINGFSFSDISADLGIKNASIHYYFPTKTDLCVAVIKQQEVALEALIKETEDATPIEKLEAYFSIYDRACVENKVCLVGSLAPDLHTQDPHVETELKKVAERILVWVSGILAEGERCKVFHFAGSARSRALLVITNMLASLQLTRLTDRADFNTIKQTILKDLTS